MSTPPPTPDLPHPAAGARLHLRVLLGPAPAAAAAIGPGKAAFLATVAEVGSIAGAGRALGLSYMKARHLLDALNGAFCGPVVETHLGGRDYGGARLTPLGAEVLDCYRAIERQAAAAVAAELDRLAALAQVPDKPAPTPASPRDDGATSSPAPAGPAPPNRGRSRAQRSKA